VPEDRRVRRSRRLLRSALLELLEERDYDAITVQDVLDRADVGRATFYAHFRDKDDLLTSGFAEVLGELRAGLQRQPSADAVGALFRHVAGHRHLWRGLARGRGGGIVRRHLHDALADVLGEHLRAVATSRGTSSRVPPEIVVEHLVSAVLTLQFWWLEHETPYSAEELARMYWQLTGPTVDAVLAPDPGGPDPGGPDG
jgi:AcrR family transcriptional regulator